MLSFLTNFILSLFFTALIVATLQISVGKKEKKLEDIFSSWAQNSKQTLFIRNFAKKLKVSWYKATKKYRKNWKKLKEDISSSSEE